MEDLLQEELAVVIIRLPIRRHRHHPVEVVVEVVLEVVLAPRGKLGSRGVPEGGGRITPTPQK